MMMSQTAQAAVKINYQLSFPEAQAHYVEVEMSIRNLDQTYTDVKMPVWTPGSYLVREFARHVEGFKAQSPDGKALRAEKINKNTWRVYHEKIADLKINYRVYAFELTVRTSFIDASHAFLSSTSIFMYPDGMLNLPSEIKIIPHKDWKKISTSLDSKKSDPYTLYAPDYDVLGDSPIELGNQDIIEFTAAGVPHYVAMVGPGSYDREKIIKDFTKIVEESAKIFGKHPCKNYTFIVHNVPSGGGGLEHLNSTTVQTQRFSYSSEGSYNSFLGLIAHEYFHLWNVKRLRPAALGPFDYDTENYTRALWVSEGFTAFYDNWLVRRAGFYTADKYLELMAADFTKQTNLAGNNVQPLSESSFDAWIKYYRRNENSNNSQVSYYDKGSLAAALINLEILHQTQGQKSLDDVMKYMYDEYYTKLNRGFTDAEMKKAIEQFAGVSFDAFYASYIDGTGPFDYNKYLDYAGLKLTDQNAGKNELYLGANTSATGGKVMVTAVTAGSPAYQYGLNVNDEILAIDGYRVDDLAKMLNLKKTGDTIKMMVSRDGMIRTLDIVLGKDPNVKYKLERVVQPTPAQDAVYKAWVK